MTRSQTEQQLLKLQQENSGLGTHSLKLQHDLMPDSPAVYEGAAGSVSPGLGVTIE